MLLWEGDLAASKEGSIQNQSPLHSTQLCLTLVLTGPRFTSLTSPKHIALHCTFSLLIGGRPLQLNHGSTATATRPYSRPGHT